MEGRAGQSGAVEYCGTDVINRELERVDTNLRDMRDDLMSHISELKCRVTCLELGMVDSNLRSVGEPWNATGRPEEDEEAERREDGVPLKTFWFQSSLEPLRGRSPRADVLQGLSADAVKMLEGKDAQQRAAIQELRVEMDERERSHQLHLRNMREHLRVLEETFEGRNDHVESVTETFSERLDVVTKCNHHAIKLVAQDLRKIVYGEVEHDNDLMTTDYLPEENAPSNEPRVSWTTETLTHLTAATHTYAVRETMWDVVLFLGIRRILNVQGTLGLVIGVLLNVIIQVMICLFVFRMAINEQGQAEDLRTEASQWAEMTDEDVVTHVCQKDFLLSTHFQQFNLYSTFAAYVDTQGSILCIFITAMFMLHVCVELRKLCDFVRAISALPRGSTTVIRAQLKRFSLESITTARLVVVAPLVLLQFLIASILLVTGTLWLVSTKSSEDLILNGLALTYIMDIDEQVYQFWCPRQIRAIVENLHPLMLQSSSPQTQVAKIFAPPALTGLFVTVTYLGFIQPHLEMIHSVMVAMCGSGH